MQESFIMPSTKMDMGGKITKINITHEGLMGNAVMGNVNYS